MDYIKKRKPNFSDTEILNLLRILERKRTLINGEANLYGGALVSAWNEVAEEYSATTTFPRNGEVLRNKFMDLKSRTKKRLLQIRNHNSETGFPRPQQLKSYEELIVQLTCLDPMNDLNSTVDPFNDIVNVKIEPAAIDDQDMDITAEESLPTSGSVSPMHPKSQFSFISMEQPETTNKVSPKRLAPKISKEDLDSEMLNIAKRNLLVQEQRLKEAKITNSLLRDIAEKLGCPCQNKS